MRCRIINIQDEIYKFKTDTFLEGVINFVFCVNTGKSCKYFNYSLSENIYNKVIYQALFFMYQQYLYILIWQFFKYILLYVPYFYRMVIKGG